MDKPLLDRMRLQLIVAYVGEHIAGGYYHRLSELHAERPALAQRLRRTAGDEIRHGNFFNACYEEHYGSRFGNGRTLMNAGRAIASLERLVPQAIVPLDTRLDWLARGEAAAVRLLERELETPESNAYLEIVERILPDERTHALPYRVD